MTGRLILTLLVLVCLQGRASAAEFDFVGISPCRLVDTRNGSGQSPSDDGPVGARPSGLYFDIATKGYCGIPADTAAVSVSITVVQPSAGGDLRIAPLDPNFFPQVSTLNYSAGVAKVSNGAIVAVASTTGADLRVLMGMTSQGNAHILIDVLGYFVPMPEDPTDI